MSDPGSCLDIFPNEAERAAARARWKSIEARHPGGGKPGLAADALSSIIAIERPYLD